MDYLYPLTLDESIFLFIDVSEFVNPKTLQELKNLIKESRRNDLKMKVIFFLL